MRAVWAPLLGAVALALTAIALVPANTEAQQSVTIVLAPQNNSGQTGVALLSSMDNAQRALDITREIDKLESDADKVSRDGISVLFREEQDVRQLIKHKNVYEYLENAIDKCQDVANVIESVVVENV